MSTEKNSLSPIYKLNNEGSYDLYVKREDMIPYSFGGNKARKAMLFFEDFDSGDYDHMVTYGSSHSNHCRIIANICAGRHIPCTIVAPSEVSDRTYNSDLIDLFGAEIITVPVDDVHDTIEKKLDELRKSGHRPYFIAGGGHGNIGTESYVRCYEEIREFEQAEGIRFDHIFLASGTGTTQAGLVCGQILNKADGEIVGISIARKNPKGRDVILNSIRDYLDSINQPYDMLETEEKTIFIDDYTGDGYGKNNAEIDDTIRSAMIDYGMPLDSTYTGKAFYGMKEYLRANDTAAGGKILFIHTGGTPLFFDDLSRMYYN
ncbi:MAG: pyridoxal-phosphate dependent enzyme [Lachnospiraceae bacterium]|nr:pyridoxal-phosphate dependent enzyme [Lachnospiraceae bacterium]